MAELEELLQGKFRGHSNLQNKLFLLLGIAEMEVLSYPSKKEVVKTAKIISKKDAPILVSALVSAKFLVTLDNEFMAKKVSEYALKHGLKVLKPGNLIKRN